MTYATLEASPAEGRPYFLYQFAEGSEVWRFTSRAEDWRSPGSDGSALRWEAAAIAHGEVVQSGEIERGLLELTWPLSHPFARRFLAPPGIAPVSLTIFRGHEQVPGETVAHWKGRVTGAQTEGGRVLLTCASVFGSLRRAGVRAKYQRLCRHALYGRGCRLDIAQHWWPAQITAMAGAALTIPAAASQPDGWYRGGVLRVGTALGFIIDQVGPLVTSSRPLVDPGSVGLPPLLPLSVDLAPGCDLRAATCSAKFDNLVNFGGFPEIPGRNPFGGGSIV